MQNSSFIDDVPIFSHLQYIPIYRGYSRHAWGHWRLESICQLGCMGPPTASCGLSDYLKKISTPLASSPAGSFAKFVSPDLRELRLWIEMKTKQDTVDAKFPRLIMAWSIQLEQMRHWQRFCRQIPPSVACSVAWQRGKEAQHDPNMKRWHQHNAEPRCQSRGQVPIEENGKPIKRPTRGGGQVASYWCLPNSISQYFIISLGHLSWHWVKHLGFPAEPSTIWSCVKSWKMLEARNPSKSHVIRHGFYHFPHEKCYKLGWVLPHVETNR